MSLQTEEKHVVAPDDTSVKTDASGFDLDAADSQLDREMGMRIAAEALWREVLRYGGQAAIVLALVGVIGYAGYWSLKEMSSLPAFLGKLTQPFMPVQPKVVPPVPPVGVSAEEKAARIEKAKATAAAASKRRLRRAKKTPPPPSANYRRGLPPISDNPTGGEIIYQDGLVTEYRWNKH